MAQRHDDRSLDALGQYMYELKRLPQLTDEEEAQLFLRVRCGSGAQHARNRLIEGYQPLVVGLAKRFVRHCHELELLDLVQEGGLALCQAIEKYDGRRESSFQAFAFTWVRVAMLTALWQYERAIRLPLHKARAIRQMNAVTTRLFSLLGREPTFAEVAREMQVKERDVRELVVLQEQQVLSLHMALDGDEEMSLEEVIVDPAASAFMEDGLSSVEDVLTYLTERERMVIRLRYGFHDGRAYTQREVADLLGVALSTVQMVDRRAKLRLRRALKLHAN